MVMMIGKAREGRGRIEQNDDDDADDAMATE